MAARYPVQAPLSSIVQFLVDHIVVVTLAIIGIAAVQIGYNLPDPSASSPVVKAAESWQLPAIKTADQGKLAETVAARNLWGTVVAVLPPAAPREPNWRIMGGVKIGAERQVVLSVENQPIRMLKVGDKLPGGSQIVEISDDSVCVLVNGKRRMLSIHNR